MQAPRNARGDERTPRRTDRRIDGLTDGHTSHHHHRIHTHARTRKHVPLAASSSSKTSFSAFACTFCCCSIIQDMLPASIPSSSAAARTRPTSDRPCSTNALLHCILRDADKDRHGRNSAPRQHVGFCPQDIMWYRFYRRQRLFLGVKGSKKMFSLRLETDRG